MFCPIPYVVTMQRSNVKLEQEIKVAFNYCMSMKLLGIKMVNMQEHLNSRICSCNPKDFDTLPQYISHLF